MQSCNVTKIESLTWRTIDSMPYTPEGWWPPACRWTISDGVFLALKFRFDARINCWMGISGDMEFEWVKIWCISTWYMDGHYMGIWVMTMIEWLTYILSSFKYVWFSHWPVGRWSNQTSLQMCWRHQLWLGCVSFLDRLMKIVIFL